MGAKAPSGMKLLAVTINYKTPEMTMDAVRALMPELSGISSKVIIVENDSQDGSYDKIDAALKEEQWGDHVELVDSGHNGGFGYGNNVGMRIGFASDSPPEYVYLLNSDAFPDEGAIRTLIDFMDARPDVGLAGSYIHGTDGEPHVTAFRFHGVASEFESNVRVGVVSSLFSDQVVPIMPIPTEACEVGWVAGASLIMRRTMLDEVGLFDETFFLYFEETDLCLRAKRQGWSTWFVPEASVAHIGSASTGAYSVAKRRPNYWFDSRRYYFEKNYGKLYANVADAAFVAGQAFWKARRLAQRKPRQDPKFLVRDFLCHKFGLPRLGD